MDIPTAKSDVTFRNDRFEVAYGQSGMQLAVGNFNGDEKDDFAISLVSANGVETEVNVVLGGTSPSGLVQATALRIRTPDSFQQSGYHQIGFGDIDHDGKDDLFIAMENPAKPGVAVLFGRPLSPGVQATTDLTVTAPDVMVEGGFLATTSADASFAVADYTGDGINDLLVGIPVGNGYVYLIPGRLRQDFPLNLNPASDPTVRLIKGPYFSKLGETVFFANILGNAAPDLLLSAPDTNFDGRINAGKVFIFDGSQPLPPVFDLDLSSATAEIRGAYFLTHFYCSGSGDLNGDGRDDLLLNINIANDFAILDGSLLTAHPLIDLHPSSPYYVPPAMVSTAFDGAKAVGGDFDGDNLKDFFASQLNALQLFPSREEDGWPLFPSTLDSPWTFQSDTGYIREAAFGDFNGDGIDDLVMAEEAHGELYWGALHIIYGFIPLKGADIQLAERTPSTSRANVTVSVQGNPTEMRLSGDIADPFKDTWIPYQVSHPITLSPAAGEKTVSVVFRNSFLRESETASDTVTLAVESQEPQVKSNLITRAQSAQVDFSLTTPGRLKATIFTRTGQKVADLVDEERSAGFWPIEWDGTNRDGRRVAPGVYLMTISAGDQESRTKILVKE